MRIEQRAAVITGAASGIGRALAIGCAGRGMRVALIDRDAMALEALAGSLPGGALLLPLDIRDDDAVRAAADRCFAELGDVALLFANAGILRAGALAAQAAAEWRAIVDVNLAGTLSTVTAFLPRMMAQAEPSRIVITGSQSSFVGRPVVTVYSATKHALWGLAEGLKFELDAADAPVGVTFVAPGAVATGLAGAAADGESPMQAGMRQSLAAHGAPADAVAEAMIEAAVAGRFWVLPNPETKAQLAARIARVLDEADPEP